MLLRRLLQGVYHVILYVTRLCIAGVTSLLIHDRPVLLTSALAVAEDELLGGFANSWPLTKVLDIGGTERCPKYTDQSSGDSNSTCICKLRSEALAHP